MIEFSTIGTIKDQPALLENAVLHIVIDGQVGLPIYNPTLTTEGITGEYRGFTETFVQYSFEFLENYELQLYDFQLCYGQEDRCPYCR